MLFSDLRYKSEIRIKNFDELLEFIDKTVKQRIIIQKNRYRDMFTEIPTNTEFTIIDYDDWIE